MPANTGNIGTGPHLGGKNATCPYIPEALPFGREARFPPENMCNNYRFNGKKIRRNALVTPCLLQ